MGSVIELNDTLQISKEQGFPSDVERQLLQPLSGRNEKYGQDD